MHARRCLVLVTPAAVLVAAPRPAASWRGLLGVTPGDPTAPLLHLVALLAWGCSAWLLLLVSTTWLSQARGAVGDLARRADRRLAPAATRTALRLALGMAVVSSASTGTALAAGLPEPTPAAASSAGLGSSPSWDWPGLGPVVPSPTASALADTPPPATPTASTPADTAPSAPSLPAAATAPRSATGTTADVVVRRGDCLWGLAERALERGRPDTVTPAQVAQAWPAWWQANRAVIGEDPDLLVPGTHLVPPAP